MSIPRKLTGGIVAWVSSCFASLGGYIYTLQTWDDLDTLPVTGGALLLISAGLGSLAVYLRGDTDVIEPEVSQLPDVGDKPDIDLSAAK